MSERDHFHALKLKSKKHVAYIAYIQVNYRTTDFNPLEVDDDDETVLTEAPPNPKVQI